MFYCEECARKHDWPESIMKSLGPCEMCERVRPCNNVPSTRLPGVFLKPKANRTNME